MIWNILNSCEWNDEQKPPQPMERIEGHSCVGGGRLSSQKYDDISDLKGIFSAECALLSHDDEEQPSNQAWEGQVWCWWCRKTITTIL